MPQEHKSNKCFLQKQSQPLKSPKDGEAPITNLNSDQTFVEISLLLKKNNFHFCTESIWE